MRDDKILTALADRNPVRDIPAYDHRAEQQLHQVLTTINTERMRPGRTRRRATWWATGIGIGVVGAVAATALIAYQPTSAPSQSTAAGPTTSTPKAPASTTQRPQPSVHTSIPVQLVVGRSTTALNSATDYILEAAEVQHLTTGLTVTSKYWQDQADPSTARNQQIGATSQVQSDDLTFRDNGVLTNLEVDYQQHKYLEKPFPEGATSTSQTGVIVRDLRDGQDKILGTSVVNGKTVLHLSNDEPSMNREIWIDPTSYLPVRMTAHGSFGSYVIDYTWIPRTSTSLSQLFTLPIPPGFVRVNQI